MNDGRVVLRVVTFLGAIGVLLAAGVIALTAVALKEGKLDSAAVALVAGVSSLAGVTLGALGSILATTRAGNALQVEPPATVTVTEPEPSGDAGHADTAHLIVITAIAVIVVTVYHLLIEYG